MDKELYGIIGVVVGTLLSTATTIIMDKYNRSKRIHFEATNAGFDYPIIQNSHAPLTGELSIYLYNDSSLPKTFMLESMVLEKRQLAFTITDENKRDAQGVPHHLAPNSAMKISYNLIMYPSAEISIPNIDGKNAILKFRSGKHKIQKTIPLYYYSF